MTVQIESTLGTNESIRCLIRDMRSADHWSLCTDPGFVTYACVGKNPSRLVGFIRINYNKYNQIATLTISDNIPERICVKLNQDFENHKRVMVLEDFLNILDMI